MSFCLYLFSPEALRKAKTQEGHFIFVLTKIYLLVSFSPDLFSLCAPCLTETSIIHFHAQAWA